MNQFDIASYTKLSSCDKVLLLAKLIRDLPQSHIKLVSTISQHLSKDEEKQPHFNAYVKQANDKNRINDLSHTSRSSNRSSPHHLNNNNHIDERDESEPDNETDETNSSDHSDCAENLIEQLLYYLPAFQKKDTELKNAYMNLIFRSIDESAATNQLESLSELQRILSVHPLFTKEERDAIELKMATISMKSVNLSVDKKPEANIINSTPSLSRLLLSKHDSLPFNMSTLPFQQYHNNLPDFSAFQSNGINVAFNSSRDNEASVFRTPSSVIQRPVKDYSSPLSIDMNKIVSSGTNSVSQPSSHNSNMSFTTPSTVAKIAVPPKRQLCSTISEPKKATTQYESKFFKKFLK